MTNTRTSLQGVSNIIRFNWHFYLIATLSIVFIFIIKNIFQNIDNTLVLFAIAAISLPTVISLLVSWYIYDFSGLYNLAFLDGFGIKNDGKIVNISAGFDETSALLTQKYPAASLTIFDFYNPELHTEISIKRARAAYPAPQNTIAITTKKIPLDDSSVDTVLLLFAAHEIRDNAERVLFFKEIHRILRESGQLIVVEHLRDMPNFMAYTVGFLHFLSERTWQKTFEQSAFEVVKTKKITPFVSAYCLLPS